jgi:glutathione S-transferase
VYLEVARAAMLTLFGNLESGNVHKVQMILAHRGTPFVRVDVAQTRGEPKRPEFLEINPLGKVPAVLFDGGDVLTESGAILYWFGQDTDLWPDDRRTQAEVLRWMFFEQYSHEPALAVLRYLRRFAPQEDARVEGIRELEGKARMALSVLEGRLAKTAWVAAPRCTLADYALYPYTKWAGEAGQRLGDYPAVGAWLARVETSPRFLPLRAEGATRVLRFEEYFGPKG